MDGQVLVGTYAAGQGGGWVIESLGAGLVVDGLDVHACEMLSLLHPKPEHVH